MPKGLRNIYAALMLAFVSLSAFAQDGAYVSYTPYSIFGVGDLLNQGSAYNSTMGGVGIAARNNRFVNIMNPASVTARDTLSFMADFGLDGRISLFSEGDKRALNTTFNIDDFVISFPMWNYTAFMVGITPMSDIGYKIAYSELNKDNLFTGRQSFSSVGNGGVYHRQQGLR